MARGRMVSKSISTCEQLAGVSFAADYLFGRCIPHLDPEGRMRGSAWDLKSQVVPKRAEITVDVIPQLIHELASARDHEGRPLIEAYEVGGEYFLSFPGFHHHNTIRRGPKGEGPSRLPAPPTGSVYTRTPGVNPRGESPGSASGTFPDKEVSSLRSFDTSKSDNGDLRARDLPASVAPFLDRFYAAASASRRLQVLGQLRQVLDPGGCPVDRTTKAFATSLTLERALVETLSTPMRQPDRAIVVVLRKLVQGRCNEVDPPGRETAYHATSDDTRRSSGGPTTLAAVLPEIRIRGDVDAAECARALEWIRQDATRLAAIEAEIDRGMANVHPRWTEKNWCVGVRAQRIDQAVVAAYRQFHSQTADV